MPLLHLISILVIMFAPNYYKQLLVNTKTSAHTLIAVVHLTINISSPIMYRSNRSFNMPPRATTRAFDFFGNYCSNSPPTRAKMPFKCPTLGSIQVIKYPHPGDISQAHKWQKDGRNAFSCRRKSHWEPLLAYLLRTKGSWKAAEIAAARSLNAQLFFVCNATYKVFWLFYIKKSYLLRYIFSTVILASRSFLHLVALRCRSVLIVASDWFVLPT